MVITGELSKVPPLLSGYDFSYRIVEPLDFLEMEDFDMPDLIWELNMSYHTKTLTQLATPKDRVSGSAEPRTCS